MEESEVLAERAKHMIGKTISHYRILEELGGGGMGVVYKAEDIKLRRTVALKFLPPELTRDSDAKQRFIQEAQAASALDHPNICTIHEIDETEDGQMFICMACYQGETLKRKIERGALRTDEAINITLHVAKALAKVHSHGIVHRDIKPANILLTEDAHVKILDFGLAKLVGQTRITKVGTTVGTVAYMSPQQVRGEEVDHRTDIWSLGVVLYEMLTGGLPFKGENSEAMIYSIYNDKPEPFTKWRQDIPGPLQRIVMKMMEKDMRKRYQDMDMVAADLQSMSFDQKSAVSSTPASSERLSTLRRRRILGRIIFPVSVGIAVIAIILLGRALWLQEAVAARRKPIAVMTFRNLTGDPSYDYLSEAIPNLLITNLEQSKDLSVMTWERMHDLLNSSGKENAREIDEDLGFELCRMDGIEAIVLGSFTRAGDVFATDVKVLDVQTKALLQSASSTGEGVASILRSQIDELSRDISRGIGISERRIQASRMRITEVTTTSMDAYNYFLRGRDDYEKFYFEDARQFLSKAVELDSTFAVAYLYLAWVQEQLGDSKASKEAFERAKAFSDRATERERLYIEASYASSSERDPDKGLRIFRQMAAKYPKEKLAHFYIGAHLMRKRLLREAIKEFEMALQLDPDFGAAMNMVAYTYAELQDYATAIRYFERYAAVSPGDANPFDSIAEIYLRMGRLDEAMAKYKEALDVKPDFGADWKVAYIYALREDYDEAVQWIDRFIDAAPSPGIKANGYFLKAFHLCWLGDYPGALTQVQEAEAVAETMNSEELTVRTNWLKGWIYYDMGDPSMARQHFRTVFHSTLKLIEDSSAINTQRAHHSCRLGLIDLQEGRVDSARSKLAEMATLSSKVDATERDMVTFRQGLLYAEVLVAQDSLDRAVSVCQAVPTVGMTLMIPQSITFYNLPPLKDVLARVHQQREDIDSAIAEYERLISFDPDRKSRQLIHPQYHYRLARLYERKGLSQEAIAQYDMFLEIVRNCDSMWPEVGDARMRLARLRAG